MLKWEDVLRMAARLNGVPVLGCRSGSPAERAGVRYGDILMAVNGMPTPDWGSFIEARARNRTGMQVEVFRAGQTLQLGFELPPRTEPVDPATLLDELIESGITPPIATDARRDPTPS